MLDSLIVSDVLKNIEESLTLIVEQTEQYTTVDDFLMSPTGVLILDGVCMNLLAVGEAVKKLDKYTDKELLPKYPSIPWKDIMRMRDVIAHHYFDVDAEKVFTILRDDVPPLLETIVKMKKDWEK